MLNIFKVTNFVYLYKFPVIEKNRMRNNISFSIFSLFQKDKFIFEIMDECF